MHISNYYVKIKLKYTYLKYETSSGQKGVLIPNITLENKNNIYNFIEPSKTGVPKHQHIKKPDDRHVLYLNRNTFYK